MINLRNFLGLGVVFALGFSVQAFAGAASSMGGLSLTDSLNPWFLQNTAEIHYCLSVDKSRFHLQADAADAKIQEAYRYWQREFSRVPFEAVPALDKIENTPRLATQNLVKVDCQANPDLIFQLGNLQQAQKSLVPDVDHTIALTVRTSYDRKNLRAKGFIYISGDDGPGPKPDSATSLQRWSDSNGSAFYLVAVHELGHIFGLPDSTLDDQSVMSYGYVQFVLGISRFPENTQFLNGLRSAQVITLTQKNFEHVFAVQATVAAERRAKELGIDLSDYALGMCTRIWFHNAELEVFVGSLSGQGFRGFCTDFRLIGSANLTVMQVKERRTPTVRLWLPPEQKVFAWAGRAGAESSDILWTMLYTNPITATGQYTPVSGGQAIPIAFEWRPEQEEGLPRISGVIDGQLISDLLAPLVSP